MAKKIKDTDYLAISSRIRAMENQLLTQQRMEQILEARTDEEVIKILQECGYPELDVSRPEALDEALTAVRQKMLSDLADSAPDPRYIDVFKIKYDYHNGKAILKADAMGVDADHMLMDLGRVPAAELKARIQSGEWDQLPARLASALAEAKEVLDTTQDPQLSDLVMDRGCYQDMDDVAEETGSAFLHGYVMMQIDAANLRALVRTIRMGKNTEFLKGVLFSGGSVDETSILKVSADKGNGLVELYASTEFRAAAEAGAEALHGGALTEFEKLCDDAVGKYVSGAQLIPFGESPLLAYLAARETEYGNLRILLMGRSAGLHADVIRSRLRASYV